MYGVLTDLEMNQAFATHSFLRLVKADELYVLFLSTENVDHPVHMFVVFFPNFEGICCFYSLDLTELGLALLTFESRIETI